MKKSMSLLVLLTLLCSLAIGGCTSSEKTEAVDAFNEAAASLEATNATLDSTLSDADALINAPEPALDDTLIDEFETATSTARADEVAVPEMPKELEEIQKATQEMNSVDYTSDINQVSSSQKAYTDSVAQLAQVTAPDEAFVIEHLQTVDTVTGVAAATEDNDPNEHLGKQGGYTSQVYFSSSLVNQDDVIGNGIIEKGTNCGGSIEVYATVEDAQARDDYLASFDGGPFSGGSHKVIGTVMVRTSDTLKASQQKELEGNIVDSLTKLED